ncbi:hypothetical protein [Pleurocapsa sp. FMAR1]|uniref:hypothetical protein n=1 Tax=Pleurocapsa sp. FMAR1 TaxID=3040204 RepID=UPI0029C7D189|nr:hypothetical protein [Pleurocapsa sp. FMAR1]
MTNQLSFPQAIATTQALMDKMNAAQLSEAEIEQELTSMIETKNGGRGFFVAYLTSELNLADNPSPGVINALKSSPQTANELLVKNLAMSSAMVVAHDRQHDLENAKGSQKVQERTCKLIQLLKSKSIENELQKLQMTIEAGQGDYQEFLQRWGYDSEQQQAIKKAIINTFS